MERPIGFTAVTDTTPLHADCTDPARLNVRAKGANPLKVAAICCGKQESWERLKGQRKERINAGKQQKAACA